jgi:hypothetical protein
MRLASQKNLEMLLFVRLEMKTHYAAAHTPDLTHGRGGEGSQR